MRQLLLAGPFMFISTASSAQWTLIPSAGVTSSFESVAFAGSVGVMSAPGALMRTTDGGDSWALTATGGFYRDVVFADANVVYCAGASGYAMFRSSNAGQTWTPLTPPTSNSLWGVTAPSPGHVFFGGTGGVVWETTNNGLSFLIRNNTLDNGNVNDIHFTSDLVGFTAQEPRKVYRTLDGGLSWTQVYQHPISTIFYSIYFSDANHGCVVGAGGAIATTTDGGANWTTQVSGSTSYLRSVHFCDANNGIATGFGGAVLRTTNGGNTWFTEPAFTTQNLETAYLFSPSSAMVAGAGGVIYKNTNLTNGIAEQPAIAALTVYPNPTGGLVTIDLPENVPAEGVRVLLTDASGRVVLEKKLDAGSGGVLDLSTLSTGTYEGLVMLADGRRFRIGVQRAATR